MEIKVVKSGLTKWFQERYHLGPFKDLLTKKQVPQHKYSLWYYLGGITLFLFILQIITGILLLFYYKPTESAAFNSIKFIMTKVEFGWLIRSLHAWGANLMVFTVFAHMFSTFFLRAYRPPRELTWVTGVFLFGLTLGTGFTGYLLPWNELSFFATKVGTQIAGSLPFIGDFLRTILRGGEEVSDATLGRFFAFHIIVLPLCLMALIGLHLGMVQLQGMSEPLSVKDRKDKKSIPFFPNFLLRDMLAWTLVLGVLVSLAVYFPAELGKKVDPFGPTPIGIKPEWYFLWMFQTLKLIPAKIFIFDGEVVGILAFGALGLILLILPFMDIWSRKEKRCAVLTVLGVLMLIFMLVMTVWSLVPAFGAEVKNNCLDCHKAQEEKRLSGPANFSQDDVHAKIGIACADCHGGDAASDDLAIAMDPTKGFIGKPTKDTIHKLCAKCHSDADYMKRYNPNIPTDQLAKYEVSQHGKLNAQGDKKSAVCTSCHDAHNIFSIDNPASPAYALNVPDTCAKCHSDKEYMKEYGIPTNQIEDYKESVHGQALLVKGDKSSPSCKHCHGNHDAGPPQAIYVGNICSQCHALTYELFSKSPHKAAHDQLGIPECEACHGKHKIMKPSDDLLGVGQDALCVKCHHSSSKGFKAALVIKDAIEELKTEIAQARALALKAEHLGMEVEEALFSINEADNSLTKARAYVHSFSEVEVCDIVKTGKSLTKKGSGLAQKALDNFNFRRKWYIFVMLTIFIFSLALYVRIRILEKNKKGG